MYTILLGMIGICMIYTAHLFRVDGPAWLGFLLIICGVIIDLCTQKHIEEELYDGRSIL